MEGYVCSRYLSRITAHPITFAVFLTICVDCGNPVDPASTQRCAQLERATIFDSGLGTGQYDKMTYFEYESEIVLTPQTDMTVSGIRPQIWYCNGTSGFLALILDEHHQPVASEAGLVDGNGEMVPAFSDRRLDREVTLKADSSYLIVISVWTTKSVGIFTTGSRSEGTVGHGNYLVHYARTEYADHLDRGGIAFQLTR